MRHVNVTLKTSRVAARLLTLPPTPMDASIAGDIAALVANVERTLRQRVLGSASGAGSSSSQPQPAQPPPQPLPQPPPTPMDNAPMPPPPDAAFALAPGATLLANFERLVSLRVERPLGAAEQAALRGAFEEGLSILQAGVAERQRLLAAPAATALGQSSAAHLWAAALEAAESTEMMTVARLAAKVTESCSALAGVLFAAGLGFG